MYLFGSAMSDAAWTSMRRVSKTRVDDVPNVRTYSIMVPFIYVRPSEKKQVLLWASRMRYEVVQALKALLKLHIAL